MGRFARSRELAAASWGVLRKDKELMVLPLISGFASLVIGVSFLVPIFVTGSVTGLDGGTSVQLGPFQYVLLFAMYVALAYVAVFFKVALLCGADERLRGGNPAVGLVGMAWGVVTFLVLPILVFEKVGVGQAIKRSTAMLRHTWGENLIVNAGIGLLAMVLILPAGVLVALGAATGTTLGLVTTMVIGGLWLIGVTCWANAMSSVFQLALYRYATDGVAPAAFARADLPNAFTAQPRRGGFLR